MSNIYQCTVDESDGGHRLDKFLALAVPQLSRARIQQLIEQGCVVRNLLEGANPLRGVAADPSLRGSPTATHDSNSAVLVTSATYKVKVGEHYTITEPAVTALDLTPAPIKLDIIYEDADLIVINKPAGMTVHPAAGTHGDTLVHALLSHCGATLSGIGGVARPGIVHRIDKETTGLLVVAKHDAAHHHLSDQLKDHSLKRTYVAFTWGGLTPRTGTVDAPLARHPRHRRQMAIVEAGRHAITHYETLQTYHAPGSIMPLASKIVCNLETGRTHQIRVHMAHSKAPLLGDPVYGATTTTRLNRFKAAGMNVPEEVMEALKGFNRQALHAMELVLVHPTTGGFMEFSAPLPDDLIALEAALTILTKRE